MHQKVIIRTSPACQREKQYVVGVLLEGFLGWDVALEIDDNLHSIEISLPGESGELHIADKFFPAAENHWLCPESLPHKQVWCNDRILTEVISEDRIPVLFGENSGQNSWWSHEEAVGRLGIDIFGSCFFLLSRYEEVALAIRDQHGRFPAEASVAYQWGVLDRPIVNEYLEILWYCIKQIWPNLERKKRQFRVVPSHDIDWPYRFMKIPVKDAVNFFLRGIKRRDFDEIQNWSWKYLSYRFGFWNSDPYNTIQWIMDHSEKRGLTSAFYYVPQQTHKDLDPIDYLERDDVLAQWKLILKYGHEIGMHPGYETYLSKEHISEAATRIRRNFEELGISVDYIGGRQHYLRWRTPDTARHLEHAGIQYDSSLGYADYAGFRCGVCYEYPLYDVERRKKIKLLERPLVVMDCTIMDEQYMNLGNGDEALIAIADLKNRCRKYNGDFTILWHNQRLIMEGEKKLYIQALDA